MTNRIFYMDGLRAVAVLSVVVYHAYWRATPAHPGWETRLFNVGAHGVDLFFVISGFCLAYPYLVQFRSEGRLNFRVHEFFAKRLLRIVPPYYATLAILSVFGVLGIYSGVPLYDLIRQSLFIDWGTRLLAAPFWTLPIEWRWYIWFGLALIVYVRKPILLGLVAVLFYVAFCLMKTDIPDFETAISFCMGIYAADLSIRSSPLRRFSIAVFLPTFLIGASLLPEAIGNHTSLPMQMASFAFVVMSGWNGPIRMLLSWSPFVWVGERSYSIYLIHDSAIIMLERYHNVAWPVAVFFGVGAGVALWALVERVTTEKAVRDRFVGWYVNRVASLARA